MIKLIPKGYRKIDFMIDMIQNGTCFTYSKILHGFWERLLNFQEVYQLNSLEETLDRLRMISESKIAPTFVRRYTIANRWQGAFDPRVDLHYLKLMDRLKEPLPENFFLAVHWLGYPNDKHPKYSTQDMIATIRHIMPKNTTDFSGLTLKQACIDGSIEKLWDAIRDMDVVVVGMDFLEPLGKKLKFPRFHHLVVDPPANTQLEKIKKDIYDLHDKLPKPVVYLFQLGGSFTSWLLFNLHGLPDAYLIDVGRTVDAWLPIWEPWKTVIDPKIKKKLDMVEFSPVKKKQKLRDVVP